MKHARKMKLVDVNSNDTSPDQLADLANAIKTNNEIIGNNTHNALSFLDQHMKAILESKNISDFDKWKQYNQALKRYLYWFKENKSDTDLNLKKATGKPHNNNNSEQFDGESDTFSPPRTSLNRKGCEAPSCDRGFDSDVIDLLSVSSSDKETNSDIERGLYRKSIARKQFKKTRKRLHATSTISRATADQIFQNWKTPSK